MQRKRNSFILTERELIPQDTSRPRSQDWTTNSGQSFQLFYLATLATGAVRSDEPFLQPDIGNGTETKKAQRQASQHPSCLRRTPLKRRHQMNTVTNPIPKIFRTTDPATQPILSLTLNNTGARSHQNQDTQTNFLSAHSRAMKFCRSPNETRAIQKRIGEEGGSDLRGAGITVNKNKETVQSSTSKANLSKTGCRCIHLFSQAYVDFTSLRVSVKSTFFASPHKASSE